MNFGVDGHTKGSALIVVLWVIGLLSLLITSFAFDAHLEARITSYYRKRTKATFLAESGYEIARLLMAKQTTINMRGSEELEDDVEDPWYADARQLAGGSGVSLVREYGDGEIHLDIVSERARRNVNSLRMEEEWEPILEVADVPEELWPALIESFLDWTDTDEEARTDGAESEDFYETLEPPYKARNGQLYTVEELLLIKGFTRVIVEGGVLDPEAEDPVIISGLRDLLTTYGDAKINANEASKRVLMTLPDPNGDADLVADEIIRERNSGMENVESVDDSRFTSDADLYDRVPDAAIAGRREYITTQSSKFFRIKSVGKVSNVDRTIQCIVQASGADIKVLRWWEED